MRIQIRNNWLFLLVVLALSGMIVALSVAMIRAGETDEPYQICVVVSDSSNGRWDAFKAGLQQASEDQDVDIRIVRTDRFGSLQEEQSIIEREVSAGAAGIIMQPLTDTGTAQMLSSLNARVPIILVDTDAEHELRGDGRLAVVKADNDAIGRDLGEKMLEDTGSDALIGVIVSGEVSGSAKERLAGFTEALEANGGQIPWIYEMDEIGGSVSEYMSDARPVDAIAALDNNALEAAADYAAQTGILLYGVGNSGKAVYYLDKSVIRSMIVPDEFSMGYHSVTEMAAYLHSRVTPMTEPDIPYFLIDRADIFSEEFETLLFPSVN